MNSPSSLRVLSFTRVVLFIMAFFIQVSVKAWDVDLTRRQKDFDNARGPSSVAVEPEVKEAKPEKIVDGFLTAMDPAQDVVILNTDKGFVPDTIRLKKGSNYRVYVVNVNEKEKNVSFILDAFSEHHGTFFGQPKSFSVAPKTEGIFSFQCPETAKQGKIIVLDGDNRKPASE